MAKVKGSMFVTFVKAIKADKTGVYDKLLTDQDKEIISKLILQSSWYPFETYKNCFNAVCQVNANNNPETLRDWGRMAGESTMSTIYKTVVNQKDAAAAIRAFKQILGSMYDFGDIQEEVTAENEMIIKVLDVDPDFEAWYWVCQGWVERTIELVIKKKVTSEILERSWEGAPATVYKMSW